MSAPFILLLIPIGAAIIVYLLRRWQTWAVIIGLLAVLIMAFFTGILDPVAAPGSSDGEGALSSSWEFFGQFLILTGEIQATLLLVYLGVGLLFLLTLPYPQDTIFIPATLTVLVPMTAALMAQRFTFGSVLLLMAAAALAVLIQGERPGSTLASIRQLSLVVLAVPFLLVAGWMIDTVQAQFLSTIIFLLSAATVILMVGFPFQLWVSPTVVESKPLVPAVIYGLIALLVTTFLLNVLVANPVVFGNSQFLAMLRLSGAATLILASLFLLTAKSVGHLLGYLLLLDIGATVIALGLGGRVALDAVLAFIILRIVGLIMAGVGYSLIAGPVDASSNGDTQLERSQGLAWRKPLGVALFIYGGLSLAGAPLTPGFSGRWALFISSQSPAGLSLVVLVLSMVVGVFVLLRFLVTTLTKEEASTELEVSPESNASKIIASGLLFIGFLLAFFPQLILSLSSSLAKPF
ncbi:MAG: proton-conducting transporter membrane subunit [Chloroflexota bacterium]|jgi:formate hydrogenlyase subunit 3/multisubunit Na+/H+ antiporter MnhD subunit